jgi:serine-type D-Ala-D-Ala carboxypeptidase/endopeptidase (penicillin-binding protein 4)
MPQQSIHKSILFSFIISSFLFTQKVDAQSFVNNFVNSEGLRNASIGITVIDINSGTILAAYNPDLSLTPASSMKVVTTAAAIATLGSEFTFHTDLQYDGTLNKKTGALSGNLYIKGFGDPTLGSDDMDEVSSMDEVIKRLAKEANRLGICNIEGRVIGDGTYFSASQPIGSNWQWDDIGNYYGAGAHGLNIRENYYTLQLQQSPNIGQSPRVMSTIPPLPDFLIENQAVSAATGTGDNTIIYAAPYAEEGRLTGTIPVGTSIFKVKGAIPDPPLEVAYLLNKTLKNDFDINIKKSAISILSTPKLIGTPRTTFTTLLSPPLKTIVKRANHESINLYCEALLRTVAQQTTGSGEPEKGTEYITNLWKGRGIDMNGFFMEDGSGLSARNAVTTRQMASIMRMAAVDNSIFPTFYESLPRAGESGTIKNMFKDTKGVGRIRAKSGSMTRVRSYTGYVTTLKGQQVSFSVIVNNYTCSGPEMRKKLEKLILGMLDL